MLKSPLPRPNKVADFSQSQDNQELSSESRAIDEEILTSDPWRHWESLVTCSSHSYPRLQRDTPQHALMVAVLRAALQDVSSHSKDSHVYRDSYKWFNEIFPYSGSYTQHMFSVESICLHLNVDKRVVQRHVKENYASE